MAGLIQDALKMRFIVLWVAASSSSDREPMSCPILCAERVLIWLASIQDGCSIWTERIGMEMGLLGRWRLGGDQGCDDQLGICVEPVVAQDQDWAGVSLLVADYLGGGFNSGPPDFPPP